MPRGRRATRGPAGSPGEAGAGRFYMISVVSKAYGIHPQTLRLYEREGLLKPSRTEGNTRLYSEEDLRPLRGVLHLPPPPAPGAPAGGAPPPPPPPPPVPPSSGTIILVLRKARWRGAGRAGSRRTLPRTSASRARVTPRPPAGTPT